jgi:5-methylcytosine-specific restriction endonuclease McrA
VHGELALSTSAPEKVSAAAVDSQRNLSPHAPPTPARIAPLSPVRYQIQLTVSRETHDRFRRAQALLRHTLPSGDAAEIFDRAITLLVEALERRRFAETSRPRVPAATSRASDTGQKRHVPAAVRRDVWRRDAGRCAFVGREGRCHETAFLEFHHVEPYAAGGEATVANIQLRCRAHNAFEARQFFGDGVVRESRTAWTANSFRNEFDKTS